MSKAKKKPNKVEYRPWQLIGMLVLSGISTFATIWVTGNYWIHNVVYDSSVGVPPSAFMQYRIYILLIALIYTACWLLLFFNTKVGYWASSVWYIVSNLLSLKPHLILLAGFYCYLAFCPPTRRWFRIGKFKTLPPRPKRKKKTS